MEATAPAPIPADVAAADAAPSDDDWPLVHALWRAGLNNGGLHRLRRVPAVYRQYRAELDGVEADPRIRFARWLVGAGKLSGARS